ncbi:hypothetical protein P9112_011170 [Eukaryota sp. TZLM1-RC]
MDRFPSPFSRSTIPGFRGRPSRSFKRTFSVAPLAIEGKEQYEFTGNIILPERSLNDLYSSELEYPFMFRLTNNRTGQFTHAGVSEFSARPGFVYMPLWMMENLGVEMEERITIEYVRLPKGSFVRLQPLSTDFLEIEQPKAVLEYQLRNYPTFTVGDTIRIKFGDKTFDLNILDLQPADAVSLIDTDVVTEFEAPVGYKEPKPEPKVEDTAPSWVKEFGYNICGWGEEMEMPVNKEEPKDEGLTFKGKSYSLRNR